MTAHTHTGIIGGITRNVFILGLVSLFTDLSSQMVFPLIPLFLTSVLGCGALVVGVVEGAAETCASFLKVVSGYWSDKIRKRKPFILFGYSMSSIIKPLFAQANAWSLVLFLRVIERIGKGLRTAPRDALVAESCDESVRGRAYGFHRAADGIGSMLGAPCLAPSPCHRLQEYFSVCLDTGDDFSFCYLLCQGKESTKKSRAKRGLRETGFEAIACEPEALHCCLLNIRTGAFRIPLFSSAGKEHRIGRQHGDSCLSSLLCCLFNQRGSFRHIVGQNRTKTRFDRWLSRIWHNLCGADIQFEPVQHVVPFHGVRHLLCHDRWHAKGLCG